MFPNLGVSVTCFFSFDVCLSKWSWSHNDDWLHDEFLILSQLSTSIACIAIDCNIAKVLNSLGPMSAD